jgi:hypothetical protein
MWCPPLRTRKTHRFDHLGWLGRLVAQSRAVCNPPFEGSSRRAHGVRLEKSSARRGVSARIAGHYCTARRCLDHPDQSAHTLEPRGRTFRILLDRKPLPRPVCTQHTHQGHARYHRRSGRRRYGRSHCARWDLGTAHIRLRLCKARPRDRCNLLVLNTQRIRGASDDTTLRRGSPRNRWLRDTRRTRRHRPLGIHSRRRPRLESDLLPLDAHHRSRLVRRPRPLRSPVLHSSGHRSPVRRLRDRRSCPSLSLRLLPQRCHRLRLQGSSRLRRQVEVPLRELRAMPSAA